MSARVERVLGAIEGGRRLAFRYSAPSGDSEREIEPCYLVFHWAAWYVWGWCRTRRDFRLFKLSRMQDLRVGEPFPARPAPLPDLRPEKVFPHHIRVRALVRPEYRWRLLEEFGEDSFREQPDGRLLFSFGFTDPEGILAWALPFGDGIELLEPAELRAELQAIGARLVERYGET